MEMNPYFIEALDLSEHPIKRSMKKFKEKYYIALMYIVSDAINKGVYSNKGSSSRKSSKNTRKFIITSEQKKIVNERLKEYHKQLFTDLKAFDETSLTNKKNCIQALYFFAAAPWLQKYLFMLVCDVALILLGERLIDSAMAILTEHISNARRKDKDKILSLLYNDWTVEKKYCQVEKLIRQFRINRNFFCQKERRIIVTANMSAGKSTLINALVGKYIARTSQEVCTGNVCYIYNKPFEDTKVNLLATDFNMNASVEDLSSYNWNAKIVISSYFNNNNDKLERICLIDTPGVDSALNDIHSELTYNVLLKESYDAVLCVMSPTQLGTDAEKEHIQWLSQNVDKNKIVFVLNKIDNYRKGADSVEESIRELKKDLLQYGFDNPVICPISAYFAYLLKLKLVGKTLTLDEEDEYDYLVKKFKRDFYDLSKYYPSDQISEKDSEEIILSKRAGVYGLEKIVYGGCL